MTALLAGSVVVATPVLARAEGYAGIWDVSGTIQSGGPVVLNIAAVCIFQQAGELISGTCQAPEAIGPATGTVDGRGISWQADVRPTAPNGASGAFAFAGTLGPDNVIRGEVKYSGMPGRVGAFTAQRP
ncbi:MAG: hypothetical protein ACHP7N_14215 [Caulobacterales bacterium]